MTIKTRVSMPIEEAVRWALIDGGALAASGPIGPGLAAGGMVDALDLGAVIYRGGIKVDRYSDDRLDADCIRIGRAVQEIDQRLGLDQGVIDMRALWPRLGLCEADEVPERAWLAIEAAAPTSARAVLIEAAGRGVAPAYAPEGLSTRVVSIGGDPVWVTGETVVLVRRGPARRRRRSAVLTTTPDVVTVARQRASYVLWCTALDQILVDLTGEVEGIDFLARQASDKPWDRRVAAPHAIEARA